MSGPDSRAELSDKDLVESVLRDLREAAEKWEALVAEAENTTYSVDLGMSALSRIQTADCWN